jgi:ATP-dependent DNA helicase RecQ
MTTASRDVRRVAREIFGWHRLHDHQVEAIEHVLDGDDVLAVLPTGAGKSAIYQVPGVLLDGPTLVVSPLIALQHDQIQGLGVDAPGAVAVNSSMRVAQRRRAWRSVQEGQVEYLFLSPEQLASEEVLARLDPLGISLFVVDEAHCVTAWGHDFRADYLRLGPVVERLGHPPVVALTATAAPPVREDIAVSLGLRRHREVMASFDRPNLSLGVRRFTSDAEKREAVVEGVRGLAAEAGGGVGLLYCASRKDTEAYAAQLAGASGGAGLRVAAYHAGMAARRRAAVHRAFLDGDLDLIVATSAFGMGIDKPDVRFVAHASVPDSLDSYYQQVGRAGRDGDPAEVVLFYRPEDLALQRFLTAAGAPEEALAEVAAAVRDAEHPLSLRELGDLVEAGPSARTRAVNLLERAGAVATDRRGRLVPASPSVPVSTAVARAAEAAEEHQRMIRSRIEMLRGYADTTGCRRRFLLGYFGEELAEPCGRCDTCAAGSAELDPDEPGRPQDEGPYGRNARVRHTEWGPGVVMSVEDDRLTVLFESEGYRTLSLDTVREQDLLAVEDG